MDFSSSLDLSTIATSRLMIYVLAAFAVVYLARIDHLLRRVPEEVRRLAASPWTENQLKHTYQELERNPPSYVHSIPPKLERRYIVTGGNGLVGGYIVLQLLARGTPPINIRILDIRSPERSDMKEGIVGDVDFIPTDVSSLSSVTAAFSKPWDSRVFHLPLTVFHTAAVILASDRSPYLYGFPEAVNVRGSHNVLMAAKNAGADIFSSTSSASISILPVDPFVPWEQQPRHFWQLMDERDFYKPLRSHEQFFGNYPASKAVAERLVCAENCESMRTGCIRPANGVYGNPTDNTVGGPLSKRFFPTWVPHIVQSFAHGANVAVAHLHHEAVLLAKDAPQAGRPFVITDPNPPISYSDLYRAIKTLSIHPLYTITVPPALMLVLSYVVEWLYVLPYRFRILETLFPRIRGDIRHLQPGLFSICTHLIGVDDDARKSVEQGGLGYKGVITTMEGMTLEILEWNREHLGEQGRTKPRKTYTMSIYLAEQLQQKVTGSVQCVGEHKCDMESQH